MTLIKRLSIFTGILLLGSTIAVASVKIGDLPTKSAATFNANDSIPLVDSVSNTTVRVLAGDLGNLPALTGAFVLQNPQSANYVLAGPTSGSSANPSFRSLIGADLPNPTAGTLGGVKSYSSVSHQWINSISTGGAPGSSQPAFTDISGSLASTQLPTPLLLQSNGIVTSPAISFSGDTQTGMYLVGSGDLAFSAAGVEGFEVKNTAGNANAGMGVAPSASANFPMLISRTNASSNTSIGVLNPSTAANSFADVEVSTDAGNVVGHFSVYSSASTVPPYISSLVIRPDQSAHHTTIMGGGNSGDDVRIWTNGDFTSTGETASFNGDHSMTLFGNMNINGSVSGQVTIATQSNSGTYIFGLPTSAGTSGQPLLSGGGGSSPQTYGTLGVGAGGTGLVNPSAGTLLLGNGSSALTALSSTAGQFVVYNGSGGFWSQTMQQDAKVNSTGYVTVQGIQGVPVSATAPTSNQVLAYNGSAYVPTAQSGGGTKNYLGIVNGTNNNGNFETGSLGGWACESGLTFTNGFPSSTPSFSSGCGSDAFGTDNTSQLQGTYSLAWSWANPSTAGHFFTSPVWTIDPEDQAKVLTCKFYYKNVPGSGTFNFSGTSSNTFGTAIYNVSQGGSNWIQPAGSWCMTQGSGSGYCTETFQTTVSDTQYRLIVYNANATGGSSTSETYFDDFSCGPQTAPMGPAVTDWRNDKTFTPSAGFGTTSAAAYWYRRVGDSAEVNLFFQMGTTTGTTALVTLPFTIDNTKLGGSTSVGLAMRQLNSTSRTMWSNNDPAVVFYDGSTTNTVYISNADGLQTFTKTGASTMYTSGDTLSISFKVPVVGWSSNTAQSSDSDNRYVSFFANAQTNASIGNVATTLDWSSQQDTHGGFNGSTTYTIPVTGTYLVLVTGIPQTASSGGGTAGTSTWGLYKNGSNILTQDGQFGTTFCGAANYCTPMPMLFTGLFNSGDQLTVKYNQNAGGTAPSNLSLSTWSVTKLGGSPIVQPTETVAAEYEDTSGQSVTATTTNFTYNTKMYDTHGAFSAGVFTCPVPGTYEVSASDYSSTAGWSAFVYKNGSSYQTILYAPNASHIGIGSTDVHCNGGDTLSLRSDTNLTRGTSASSVWVAFKRIGN